VIPKKRLNLKNEQTRLNKYSLPVNPAVFVYGKANTILILFQIKISQGGTAYSPWLFHLLLNVIWGENDEWDCMLEANGITNFGVKHYKYYHSEDPITLLIG
jgi:hypothetical protein